MNYLIKIEQRQIGTELVESVNARELHEKLQVGRDFSNWIKGRIEELNVLENIDYARMAGSSLYAKIGENLLGGRPSIEYAITLDFAKHLAMVEKNEIGRQIRQYFIDFEKQIICYTKNLSCANTSFGPRANSNTEIVYCASDYVF